MVPQKKLKFATAGDLMRLPLFASSFLLANRRFDDAKRVNDAKRCGAKRQKGRHIINGDTPEKHVSILFPNALALGRFAVGNRELLDNAHETHRQPIITEVVSHVEYCVIKVKSIRIVGTAARRRPIKRIVTNSI